jgi:metal-dependent amidase/aminoacylase/carboxypeptidase family protein
MARAATLEELGDVQAKVFRCFEAGALATGAALKIEGAEKPYAHMVHDHVMSALYQGNATVLGRSFVALGSSAGKFAVSTDMGNVSLAMPSIHPAIGIESFPAVNHQPEFAAHCVTPAADQAVVDAAAAMAWTALDMTAHSEIRQRLMRG